jgi:hypothetical protein
MGEMQAVFSLRNWVAGAAFAAALCQVAGGQGPAQPAAPPKASTSEIPRLRPRAAAHDYRARTPVGKYELGAEFKGHVIPTPELALQTENYIALEVGLFGPADSRLVISREDFTLKINDKKAVPAQSFVTLYDSIKDPLYETPEQIADKKARNSDEDKGENKGEFGSDRNPRFHPIPFAVRRDWEQRLAKSSLPEGDRALPEGGLLYFSYRGRDASVLSLQLYYSGPAGKATLDIEP